MPKERCNAEGCKVKLTFTNCYECKCGFKFCSKHRLPESHVCNFDFKITNKLELENNMRCVKEKLIKI